MIIALGLLGAGGFVLIWFRRRADERDADTSAGTDPTHSSAPLMGQMPLKEGLDDPLLEAMASTARQRGRRGAIPPAPDAPTPIATWVKRLDAEINVMADLAAAPTPPPERGAPARPAEDKSLTA